LAGVAFFDLEIAQPKTRISSMAPCTRTRPGTPDLVGAIARCFWGKICHHADLNLLARQRPVQLAYALSLLHAPDTDSIIPPWLLFKYPELPEVMYLLRTNVCNKPECHYCRYHLNSVLHFLVNEW
jgi:hypothetical protein